MDVIIIKDEEGFSALLFEDDIFVADLFYVSLEDALEIWPEAKLVDGSDIPNEFKGTKVL